VRFGGREENSLFRLSASSVMDSSEDRKAGIIMSSCQRASGSSDLSGDRSTQGASLAAAMLPADSTSGRGRPAKLWDGVLHALGALGSSSDKPSELIMGITPPPLACHKDSLRLVSETKVYDLVRFQIQHRNLCMCVCSSNIVNK